MVTVADGFEVLFDANPRPMFVFERQSLGLVAVNEAACALYGWTRDELLGMNLRELRHTEERPFFDYALAREREHHKPRFKVLSRHITKDGRARDVDVEMSRLEFRGRACTLALIIELTEGETSLRRSEENFRTLIERLPIGTIVHRRGLIIYINPAAVRGLRYDTAAELVGRPLLDLVHPCDRERIQASATQTAQEGLALSTESRMLRRDGSIAVIEAEGLMLDFDGHPANVVIAQEVTERRELFARVATADRLVSMGTLAAGVAHEINNPLAYLVSNLEVLARELPTQYAGPIADARDAAERVSSIVRDLRELARPDDELRAVDVAAILASSIKMATNELRHRATLVTNYAPELPRVRASPSRLGQVFLNLLVNAAHAMMESRGELAEVRVRTQTRGERVYVEIEDTGVGIPAENLGRVFDPFFTTKPLGVGIGLGLAISHQIITSIGGEISVTSEVGKGTTFRIALRAASPEQFPEPTEATPVVARRLRILLIDDEVAVGRAVANLLSPDHEVTPVARASVALARLESGEEFDVILCGLMMPELDGIELYARLSPPYRERIVFVTGGAFTPQARTFLSARGSTHLEKPFTEKQLRQAIARIVAR
ncbi:hypothetical protein BH11MYX1_BH11MYX1_27960 [soil metagenome]